MAKRLGAKVYQVPHGYLSVVQARARVYCVGTGAMLAPFGMDVPAANGIIAGAAIAACADPAEVWCAFGSGVLAVALARAWPNARCNVEQVGRTLAPRNVAGAMIHVAPSKFGDKCRTAPPFPADPHYDAKAWEICKARRGRGLVLFWNVTGPAN